VAALPVLGLLLWIGLLALETIAVGLRGRVSRDEIVKRLLPLAPEQVGAVTGSSLEPPTATAVLARLAAERKLAVQVDPGGGHEDAPPEVRLRLLVPLASLLPFERESLQGLLGSGNEVTSQEVRQLHQGRSFDPDAGVARLWRASRLPPVPPRRLLVAALLVPAGLFGFVQQFRAVAGNDYLLFVLMFNVLAGVLVVVWPWSWWYSGRPKLPLMLPFGLWLLGFLALQLSVNRPLPPDAWFGAALVVLACHATLLAVSRMPMREPYLGPRDLARIARFAAAELRRASPKLEDEWIPRLRALGLGRAIDRWRSRHGDLAFMPPDLSTVDAGEVRSNPAFTGRTRDPLALPRGWIDAFRLDTDS
jgi:hypothetical protein